MIKMIVTILFFVFTIHISSGQVIPKEYNDLVQKAESLYQAKDYKNAAAAYSSAFKAFGWKAFPDDRYKAAGSWAMANVPDSAFFQLQQIEGYSKIVEHAKTDPVFKSMHADKRWQRLLNKIEEKKKLAE